MGNPLQEERIPSKRNYRSTNRLKIGQCCVDQITKLTSLLTLHSSPGLRLRRDPGPNVPEANKVLWTLFREGPGVAVAIDRPGLLAALVIPKEGTLQPKRYQPSFGSPFIIPLHLQKQAFDV